jgi:hypothetical protein
MQTKMHQQTKPETYSSFRPRRPTRPTRPTQEDDYASIFDHTNHTNNPDRIDQNDQTNHTNQTNQTNNPDQSDQTDQTDQINQTDHLDRLSLSELVGHILIITNSTAQPSTSYTRIPTNNHTLTDFPKPIKDIFDPFTTRITRQPISNQIQNWNGSINISLYSSILTLLIQDYATMAADEQFAYITKLRNELTFGTSNNVFRMNLVYRKYGLTKSAIVMTQLYHVLWRNILESIF